MKEILLKELERLVDNIKSGRLECDEEQMRMAIGLISHKPVSKEVACEEILHWSRSKFDEYISKGLLPKGRKRRGWKELVWYEDELLEYKRKLK